MGTLNYATALTFRKSKGEWDALICFVSIHMIKGENLSE